MNVISWVVSLWHVTPGESLLLHPEFDCFDGIGRVHRIVLRLIGQAAIRWTIPARLLRWIWQRNDGRLNESDVVARTYSFSVILEPQEQGGFSVLVPALPEVVTEGDTEEEALANAEEAIGAILSYRRDNGIPIPADAHPEM